LFAVVVRLFCVDPDLSFFSGFHFALQEDLEEGCIVSVL
jgi:hypothetical protein